MRVYLDNVVASGLVVADLDPPTEMAAARTIEKAHRIGVLKMVTSRQSWREQERTRDPERRTSLEAARGELSAVWVRALRDVTGTPATKLMTAIATFCVFLNVLVEAWQDDPTLKDPTIDQLVRSRYVDLLRQYRNHVMHPNLLSDRRLKVFLERPELIDWAQELASAFTRFARVRCAAIGPERLDWAAVERELTEPH